MKQQDQLPASSNVALKEWAVVCEAIRRGRQSLLFRTGGISEQNGRFEMKHPCFWLFPTRFHQAAELISADFAGELTSHPKKSQANQLPIDLFCTVKTVNFIDNIEKLSLLRDRHVLSEEVLRQRFEYRSPGLYVISFDAYPQEEVQWIDPETVYDGCHSWVELSEILPIINRETNVSNEMPEQ